MVIDLSALLSCQFWSDALSERDCRCLAAIVALLSEKRRRSAAASDRAARGIPGMAREAVWSRLMAA